MSQTSVLQSHKIFQTYFYTNKNQGRSRLYERALVITDVMLPYSNTSSYSIIVEPSISK